MKILYITNLAPLKENPISGIFIVKRLEQIEKFGVEYKALSLGFRDGFLLNISRKILNISQISFLNQIEKINFTTISVPRNLVKLFLYKTGLISHTSFAKEYLREIETKININDFDLIHAHGMFYIPAGEVAYYLSKKYKKPFVVTAHGGDVNLLMPERKSKYIEVFENASKTIFVSKALLEKAKLIGYSGENSVVIPNGYDPEVFYPMDKKEIRKELGIYKEGVKYVGFVGNLLPVKRVDKLPEIFGNILKENANIRFIIVGDGNLREKLKAQVKGMDVVFTGRVSQEKVAKYMNAMDVMILPSRSEGWPCVILESHACGTCVIGSSNGGIPEAIGFKEYVVDEGREFEKRFAKKVVKVLNRGYDRSVFINRAKNFTWEEIVRKETEIYRNILERKS